VIHELPLERANLHGHFSRELPPVLTVDPGDSVPIDVPNANDALAVLRCDAWS
jgi:acetamidase/formamidase